MYMLLFSAATLASEVCDHSALVFRDPHLNFAFGGTADFRGRHKAVYNFLSAPGLSVNVKIEEAVFKLHDGALAVNGSFLTEAHLIGRISPQRQATASFWASELDESNFGWKVVNGTCVGRPYKFGYRGHKKCFDLDMSMDYSSATFAFRNWTVTVHGMRSCKGCLIAGPEHRLDISFTAHGDPSRDRPHGIIGQSYATPGLVRHGKKDTYPWAGNYTTSAQAEGAIEGTASDYDMQSAHATKFTFSRFDAAASALAAAGEKSTDASSIDRISDPSTEGNRRRLSEAACPPPPAASQTAAAPPSPCSPPAYDVLLPGGVAAVSVDLGLGTCTNAGIIGACAAQGLKPLCDNPYHHTSGGGQCLHPAQDTYRDPVAGGVYYSSPDLYSGRSYTLCYQRIPMGFPPGDGSFHGVCMYAQGNGATKPLKQHHSTHSFGDSGHNDKSFHTYCQSELGPGSYNEGCFLGEPTPCDAYPYLGNKFSRQSPPYSAETANPAYIGTRPNPTGNDMAACKPESEGGMGCWKTLCVEEGSDGGPVSLPADAGTPGKPASGSGCE